MRDGAPYRHLGEVKPGGIVCVADHASNHVPDDVDLGIAPELLDQHIAVDIGVEAVVEHMASHHSIPAHLACQSRLVIDLHREEDHPGLIPEQSDGHLISGNIGVDREGRLARFYRPYHNALEGWLDAAQPSLILSLHSFTPRLATSNEERPWEVALLYNADDRAARHAIRFFSQQGLHVGDNQPYSGLDLNATMNRHAEAYGRPYCAIEVRQDLVATKAEQIRWAGLIADVASRVALALD
ncbi:MAG: N-formylglutamate amidohydrolase [Pseudomonadota bacterium]